MMRVRRTGMKPTEEANKLVAIAAIFTTLPADARFRTLAFLTASTLQVGSDPISEALYAHAARVRGDAQRKREERRQKRREKGARR